jgi:hypothetical protein
MVTPGTRLTDMVYCNWSMQASGTHAGTGHIEAGDELGAQELRSLKR